MSWHREVSLPCQDCPATGQRGGCGFLNSSISDKGSQTLSPRLKGHGTAMEGRAPHPESRPLLDVSWVRKHLQKICNTQKKRGPDLSCWPCRGGLPRSQSIQANTLTPPWGPGSPILPCPAGSGPAATPGINQDSEQTAVCESESSKSLPRKVGPHSPHPRHLSIPTTGRFCLVLGRASS